MTYRDDADALEGRQTSLVHEIDEVRSQARKLQEEESLLQRELAGVRGRLLERPGHRRLPLASVEIASPCSVSWDAMTGDEKKRFCADCNKHVHNLSAMTRDEVESFLLQNSEHGSACVRLYQRADGTMLTADCPVGVRRRRMRLLLGAGAGLGGVAFAAFTALVFLMVRNYEPAPDVVTILEPIPQTVQTVFVTQQYTPYGSVWIEAPAGTKIYENNRLIGTAPMQITTTTGTHVLRADGPKPNQHDTQTVMILEGQMGHVDVRFDRPPPERFPHVMGVMAPPKDWQRGKP